MAARGEYVEQVVATFREATAANQKTPLREGNVVAISPPHADDVMITGDLHGHRANFEAIGRVAELERRPGRHLVLQEVCHGGPVYPAGGCMSHAMLEDVARLKVRYPAQVHFIMSNHELAELMDFPIVKGRQMLNFVYRCGLRETYGPATEEVRRASLDFLRSCPLAVRLSGGVFVCHSVPEAADRDGFDVSIFERPLAWGDYAPHTPLFNLVWGRDYRSANARAFTRLVGASVLINGHDPCDQGYKVVNDTQIILDCSHRPAAYVILPADEHLTQAEIVRRIELLPEEDDSVSPAGGTNPSAPDA